MKLKSLIDSLSDFRLVLTHYTNYLFHYPSHKAVPYILPVFKMVISSLIFQMTVSLKKKFPNFYEFLRGKKKLKKSVKNLVKYDKKKN